MADSVIVINEGFESRTSKTGKQRVTIRVKSEPLAFNLDPKQLGRPIAEMIVHHFRERIKGITSSAAANTIKARLSEAKAYATGKPWAVKRFSGGRTGATPPTTSTTAFNHSGRTANSITGNASSDGSWRINVAANRLHAETGNIDRIVKRLSELVPEIANPALLLESDVLRKGIEKAQQGMIKKLEATSTKAKIEIIRGLFKIGQQLADIAAG